MTARAHAPAFAAGAWAAAIFVALVTGVDVVRNDAGSSLPDAPLPIGGWWPDLAGPALHAARHRVAAVVAFVAAAVCIATQRGARRRVAVAGWAAVVLSAGLAWHVAPLPLDPAEGALHAGLALVALVAAVWIMASPDDGRRVDRAWITALTVVVADALVAAWLRRLDDPGVVPVLGASAVFAATLHATRGHRRPARVGLVAPTVLLLLRRVAVQWSAPVAPLYLDLPVSAALALAATWCAARPGASTDPAA